QERLRAQAPQTYVRVEQAQPLALADVQALAKAGLSDDVIVSQIQNTRSVYHLSVADILDLRNSGVSDKVINFMINTAAAAPAPAEAVVPQPPPPPQPETAVVAPAPGYVWVA